ncbi:hypothetical protein E2C01_003737 [Portunus trituberculatus]|uniref:Uncharacterized protein n=1 Tax=Portunus trituberculatus TaxID=210409 RepID=A0A5B7CQZ6_PORTR|nr:hypothetical protein [Portunus trituberculatus]
MYYRRRFLYVLVPMICRQQEPRRSWIHKNADNLNATPRSPRGADEESKWTKKNRRGYSRQGLGSIKSVKSCE